MSSLKDRLLSTVRFTRAEWEMHIYQETALDFLINNPFCALFIDTGLGKTIILLTLIARLIERDIEAQVLVIAPVRVATQTWPTEIGEWQHTSWLGYTVIRAEDDDPEVISAGKLAYELAITDPATLEQARIEAPLLRTKGEEDLFFATTEKEEAAARRTIKRSTVNAVRRSIAAAIAGKAETAKKQELRDARFRDGTNLHIINREALGWLIDQYSVWVEKKVNGKIRRVRKIVGWPYRTVVIDESSGFKDHRIARFKALVAVRAQGFIDRMHELTATPAAEGYMGLFAQIYLLDRGERLGANITAYREEFFKHNHYARTYKLLPGAKEKISDRIADICLVMKSADYLEEEDPLFLDRKIKMTEFEMAMYRKFERDFILTLPDGEEIEAETAASLSSKLLQLASGAVYTKDKETRVVHDHKIEDLRELEEELQGSPLLVAYWYKSSLARLKKAFPHAAVMDKSGKMVKPWNEGKIKMLLVHPAGVAHGLNMQYGPGHDLYVFDACWSFELFYQLYRRLARQGQKLRVRVHLPQMVGTNDELVVGRLHEKEDAQEFLFRRIKAMWITMKKRLAAAA